MYLPMEEVSAAEKSFNLDKFKNRYNIDKVISRFLKGDITSYSRISTKNNLLIHLIESKNLPLNLEVPVRHQCKECHGRGFELIPFATEKVKCMLRVYKDSNGKEVYEGCNGTGSKIDKCTRCDGTGKIGENPCPTCWDKIKKRSRGTYLYKKTKNFPGKKCLICQGTGEVIKVVKRETTISEMKICTKCNGSGINLNIGTPVIKPEDLQKMVDIQDLVKITNEVYAS
jgi:DnaJ-class molecular chaperone